MLALDDDKELFEMTEKELKKPMADKQVGAAYVFTLAKAERGKLAAGMVLAAIGSVLSLVPYIAVYRILEMIIARSMSAEALLHWAVMCVAAAAVQAVLMSIAGICSHTAAFNTMHTVKIKVLQHISYLNAGFFQKNAAGKIKTTLFDDIDRVEAFLAHSTLELTQAAVVPLAMFVFMLHLHWLMALVMLVPMVLGSAVPMMMIAASNFSGLANDFAKDMEALNASATEYISAMPVMKMYRVTAEKFQQYKTALQTYTVCWKKMCTASCNPLSAASVILDSAILFTLPTGGFLYVRGSLSVSSFLIFILLTVCFYTSFLNSVTIAMQSMELGGGLAAVKKILEEPQMKSGTKTLPLNGRYDVRFDGVSFSYGEDGRNALNDVLLCVKAGTVNAFVGASGAGKTTAAQLIGRYWDSSAGTISIGGIPVTELQTENLMALTSFVFQDVFLLEDTLLENIRMGSAASLEEVRKAAQAAQIDDFIMSLPDGYETKIGTEGVKVSGGERQRISIARALVKNAPILIFDEATSYSDIQNEHKIQVALQNLLKEKTVIMIAHRLHTIKNADTIFVFEKGSIAEQGSHTELMNKNGLYAQMQRTYISALNHGTINAKEEN